MKIEKLNENQIRCTLTMEDLSQQQIRLSELAYGTEKAQALFRRMMAEARRQFNFDAENMPLMIEAIPMKSDSIVLIITKVEDPEELDTRFAKFTPSAFDQDTSGNDVAEEIGKNVADLFHLQAEDAKAPDADAADTDAQKASTDARKQQNAHTAPLVRLYRFSDIDTVIQAAKSISGSYRGVNSLYRTARNGTYTLILSQSKHSLDEFNKICNVLSEYGTIGVYTPAGAAHLSEHETCVLKTSALQTLAGL